MSNNNNSQKKSFILLISIFFFWGFIAASNDILTPVFKKALNLTQTRSQLISFIFYIAYTIGSLGYIFISKLMKKDILSKLGYKNGLILGMLISAVGAFLFYPASITNSYYLFLLGLFIIGIGFSLQQTAANPLVINLGEKTLGSQRLSLAGGINNVGTTIGPVIVGYFLFKGLAINGALNIENVRIPYIIMGLLFILVSYLIKISSIPDNVDFNDESDNKNLLSTNDSSHFNLLKYPQVYLGMIAIFIYVGVEVSTGANLGDYLKKQCLINEQQITPYISLYWASLMIGRWAAVSSVFSKNKINAIILKCSLPFLAFLLFLLVNYIGGHSIKEFGVYVFFIILIIIGDILSKNSPSKQLMIYSIMAIIMISIGIFYKGKVGAFMFISVCLFFSTIWPCIFSIAIYNLGIFTNQASSLLIMMIMGGGIISMFQGWLSENFLNITNSYVVGIACFIYLFYYGYRFKSLIKN